LHFVGLFLSCNVNPDNSEPSPNGQENQGSENLNSLQNFIEQYKTPLFLGGGALLALSLFSNGNKESSKKESSESGFDFKKLIFPVLGVTGLAIGGNLLVQKPVKAETSGDLNEFKNTLEKHKQNFYDISLMPSDSNEVFNLNNKPKTYPASTLKIIVIARALEVSKKFKLTTSQKDEIAKNIRNMLKDRPGVNSEYNSSMSKLANYTKEISGQDISATYLNTKISPQNTTTLDTLKAYKYILDGTDTLSQETKQMLTYSSTRDWPDTFKMGNVINGKPGYDPKAGVYSFVGEVEIKGQKYILSLIDNQGSHNNLDASKKMQNLIKDLSR
jgi:hypothetical protein